MSVFSLPIFVHQWRDPNYETFRQSFQKIADQVALPADDNIELIRTGFHGGADHSFYKGNTGNGGEGLAVAFLPQSAAMARRDNQTLHPLSLIHISEPTRLRRISYAVFCLKKKKKKYKTYTPWH